jgi:adenylate cyclase class 2
MQESLWRRNIELKARCADLGAAREAAKQFGAEFFGVLEQRDTYFNVARGRLKLREFGEGRAELIAYARENEAGARASDYRIVRVEDAAAMREALTAALGVIIEVMKRRELWTWKNVRIHLDQVEGLGAFVEFEAVMEADDDDEQGHQRVKQLAGALGIGKADVVGESYCDLLQLKPGRKV